MAGIGPAAHRRGRDGHRLSSPRGGLRDDRRTGASRARSHPGDRRNGRAAGVGSERAARLLGALAGDGRPDGRPPNRFARAERSGWSCRREPAIRPPIRLRAGPPMNDLLSVLSAMLLIGVNAFFVAAEFSLISARRDRLQALAEQGKASAVTVIRAGEQLPAMLAGAQLGVTVSSLLLGRIGEPAVADLLQASFGLTGIRPGLLHTLSFVIALAIVVTLHVLLGEMVPKNIALAGPERTAMLLIPPYLLFVRPARPIIVFYNKCANAILRVLRVEPKDELVITVSTVELSEMIAESVSEGLLDREEHTRLTRALRIRNRMVADVAVPVSQIRAVPAAGPGFGPTVEAVEKALATTGYSRFPVADVNGRFIGYLHIKDVLPLSDNPHAVVDLARVRPLPQVADSLSVPEALSRMRRSKSHLALVTGQDGTVVAMVALEDLVQDLVGVVRDGMQRV